MSPEFNKFTQFHYPLKKTLLDALSAPEPERNGIINEIAKQLLHEETVTRWTDARGDYTHRLDYSLNRDSIVFDVGGFKGEWSASIYCRYACKIHVFEPMTGFTDIIRDKFRGNSDITVHEFGLSRNTGTIRFTSLDDGTTQFRQDIGERFLDAHVVDVSKFINDIGVESIDLMKLNVEGAEYDILERMIDTGIIDRVKNLQIQFHDFVPDAVGRRKLIQVGLSRTHSQTFNYDFVWEGWRKK